MAGGQEGGGGGAQADQQGAGEGGGDEADGNDSTSDIDVQALQVRGLRGVGPSVLTSAASPHVDPGQASLNDLWTGGMHQHHQHVPHQQCVRRTAEGGARARGAVPHHGEGFTHSQRDTMLSADHLTCWCHAHGRPPNSTLSFSA